MSDVESVKRKQYVRSKAISCKGEYKLFGGGLITPGIRDFHHIILPKSNLTRVVLPVFLMLLQRSVKAKERLQRETKRGEATFFNVRFCRDLERPSPCSAKKRKLTQDYKHYIVCNSELACATTKQ